MSNCPMVSKTFVIFLQYRSLLKKKNAGKYVNKIQQKIEYENARPKGSTQRLDPSDELFHLDPTELE